MKNQNNILNNLIEETLSERQWNKDSKTPRDYSKEYNPPGSQEQEERNKRKRDKRKHDKEHGECPHEQELHHVDGIEKDKVECEPPYINRGRKEKSRLKKGEIVIKIKEQELKKIVQEEAQKIFDEGMFSSLAGLALKGAQKVGSKLGKLSKGAADKAAKEIAKAAIKKPHPAAEKVVQATGGGIETYDDLEAIMNSVLGGVNVNLKGSPGNFKAALVDLAKQAGAFKHAGDVEGGEEEAPPPEASTPTASDRPDSPLGTPGLAKAALVAAEKALTPQEKYKRAQASATGPKGDWASRAKISASARAKFAGGVGPPGT